MNPMGIITKSIRRRRRLAQLKEFEFHLWEAVGPAVSREHLWHMAYGGYGDQSPDITFEELQRLCDLVWDDHLDSAPAFASLSYAAVLVAEIEKPPGARVARVLELMLPRSIYEAYARPAIGEWQTEYIEALGCGDATLARIVRLRGLIWIALPILDCFWRLALRLISAALSKSSR